MKITFIRHGHSQSNELNILSSSADDEFYLTDKGVAEIKKAALEFRPSAVENVIFISSPLKRTVHSAQVYMKAIGKSNDELAIDPRIRELDYGKFSGKENVGHIQEKIDEAYSKFKKDGDNLFRVGKTGENNYEFLMRNYRFLNELCEKYINNANVHVVVFSHAGPIRAMENVILNSSEHRSRIANGEFRTHEIKRPLLGHIRREVFKLNNFVSKNTKHYDVIIGGAGPFGLVCAERLASAGKNVLILEKESYIGGTSSSYIDEETGIEVHRFGPHIFHIKDEKIHKYVSKFKPLNNYVHKIKAALVQDETGEISYYDMPLNLNSINDYYHKKLTPKAAQEFISKRTGGIEVSQAKNAKEAGYAVFGKELFESFFKNYTEKQWGRLAETLPPDLFSRYQIRWDDNNEAFAGQFQGIPETSYDDLFKSIVSHANETYGGSIDIIYNADFLVESEKIERQNGYSSLKIFTGAIDEYFKFSLGELAYRSLKFEVIKKNMDEFQPVAVVNYPQKKYKYTRVTEYKHFHPEAKSSKTIVGYEFPVEYTRGLERIYPIEDEKNKKLYRKYKLLAEKEYKDKRVLFGGRLGEYRYYDLENTIKSAIELADKIVKEYL